MASGTLPGTMGFIHLLRRSLVYRKGRVAAMLAGLTLSAAVVTALLGIYADLNAKLNLEFRSFGANVVLTAANDASLPDDIATQVGHIAGPGASAVPLAFAVADLPDQTPVVIAGTDLKAVKAMNPWWKLTSRGNEHGVIAGERAWQAAGSPTQMALRFNGKNLTLPVSATLSTGEDDDSRIFMETSDFFPWTGTCGSSDCSDRETARAVSDARRPAHSPDCGRTNQSCWPNPATHVRLLADHRTHHRYRSALTAQRNRV
jgi:putative ABC transport system permease protein